MRAPKPNYTCGRQGRTPFVLDVQCIVDSRRVQHDKLNMLREVWALLLLAAVLHAKTTAPLGRLEIVSQARPTAEVGLACETASV